ncbi:MAG: hypothetical protein WC819_05050 [Parcubacteria group bacterium]|jgi:hypothetical protein
MKKIIQKIYVLLMPMVMVAQNAYASVTKPESYGLVEATSFSDIIETVIMWILTFAGSLAVLMIVVAGVMYMTSVGDSAKTDKAKELLTASIIGLVIVLVAYVIVVIVGEVLGAGW